MIELQDKILGSMVGGAVGDALGYPIEFLYSFDDIRAKYGEAGVLEYDTSYPWLEEHIRFYKAQISDDTQMSLYTAEGLLYALNNDSPIVPMICNAYMYWLGPQIGMKTKGLYPSELIGINELNQRRAPGHTCLSALMSIYSGKEPSNNSKGNGGLMRIAPIALYGSSHNWSIGQTASLAGEVAEITHQHQMSTLSSACQAAIIQQCIFTEENTTVEVFANIVNSSLKCVANLYPASLYMEDFSNLINKALRLLDSPLEDWQIIENGLGAGWVAEETLAIAIFSVARHINSFKNCVVCAVNHGGDSDSTGAVAGNIIGAILGYSAIPDIFTKTLQLRETIEKMANDLYEG